MQKLGIAAIAVLCSALSCAAQSPIVPFAVNVRFSEQISNGPAGSCGCFSMEGGAIDAAWRIHQSGKERAKLFAAVAEIGVEHTGSVNDAPYGLTLTTLAGGPRFAVSTVNSKTMFFAQSLVGIAFGTNSQFPKHNSLESSANSFAVEVGAGAEYRLRPHIALRLPHVEYLRTGLPNNTNNWQNNLRIGAGITFRFH